MTNDVFRWLHLFFGIVWIGLLYYLNFVQVPTMPKVPAELKKGVTGYIAPKRTVLLPLGCDADGDHRPRDCLPQWLRRTMR